MVDHFHEHYETAIILNLKHSTLGTKWKSFWLEGLKLRLFFFSNVKSHSNNYIKFKTRWILNPIVKWFFLLGLKFKLRTFCTLILWVSFNLGINFNLVDKKLKLKYRVFLFFGFLWGVILVFCTWKEIVNQSNVLQFDGAAKRLKVKCTII